MIIVISSAKTLDFKPQKKVKHFSIPSFIDKSNELIKELQKLSPNEIKALLKISFKLANLNLERYLEWNLPFTSENAKQAILAFKGEVYRGIKIENYSETDLLYAQDHLRIISGLYGLLRPLDLIQPYRLEMGIPLVNSSGENLYQFWSNLLTNSLLEEIRKQKERYLINLASNEYFKAINTKKLPVKVITPVFYETKGDEQKVIVVYTKKARGLMTSFILRNQLTNPDDIKLFDYEGYNFAPDLSDNEKFTFIR